jgi:hypothetical protein
MCPQSSELTIASMAASAFRLRSHRRWTEPTVAPVGGDQVALLLEQAKGQCVGAGKVRGHVESSLDTEQQLDEPRSRAPCVRERGRRDSCTASGGGARACRGRTRPLLRGIGECIGCLFIIRRTRALGWMAWLCTRLSWAMICPRVRCASGSGSVPAHALADQNEAQPAGDHRASRVSAP